MHFSAENKRNGKFLICRTNAGQIIESKPTITINNYNFIFIYKYFIKKNR